MAGIEKSRGGDISDSIPPFYTRRVFIDKSRGDDISDSTPMITNDLSPVRTAFLSEDTKTTGTLISQNRSRTDYELYHWKLYPTPIPTGFYFDPSATNWNYPEDIT